MEGQVVGMPKLPFHSFAFTLIENKRPRASLRMAAAGGDMYDLRVQKGSATNPTSQFTRQVPLEVAERLRDTLQSIGAFGWDESYGDTTAPGSRRWTMSVVFEEGVFSIESKGGSDVPAGFDDLLEELYRMDFPRPQAPAAPAEMQQLLSEAESNPEALATRMKSEFQHLSPAEQDQLLDALAATGLATRDWWERFFRS